MLEATNKVLYLCLVFFFAHPTCFNHRVKYIAKLIKSKTLMNNKNTDESLLIKKSPILCLRKIREV